MSGPSRSHIAKDLGISESCLRNWVHQADVDEGRKEGLTTAEREELTKLRREVWPWSLRWSWISPRSRWAIWLSSTPRRCPSGVSPSRSMTGAGGGICISDMAALDQPDLFGDVASDPTIWRTFQGIDEAVLDALRRARAAARVAVWAAA